MTESEYIELKVNRVKRKALGTGVHYRLRNKNHAFDLIGTLHLSLSLFHSFVSGWLHFSLL